MGRRAKVGENKSLALAILFENSTRVPKIGNKLLESSIHVGDLKIYISSHILS